MSDFSEAFKWLKNGEKVRRKCWEKDKYLKLLCNKSSGAGLLFLTQSNKPYPIRGYDCLQDDWELFDKEFSDDKKYCLVSPSAYLNTEEFFL